VTLLDRRLLRWRGSTDDQVAPGAGM
jgi:hypothetical protein